MSTFLQQIEKEAHKSHNEGYELLKFYRDNDEDYKGNIPIEEWFQKRIGYGPGYDAWASMTIERDGDLSIINRPWYPEGEQRTVIDISDAYFRSLNADYSAYYENLPSAKKKKTPYETNQAQEDFKEKEKRNCRFGIYDRYFWEEHGKLVRLFSGTEYMLLFYPKFLHEDKKLYLPPHYNRKISQLADIIEILQNYDIGPYNRERLFVAKCRGAMFTTTNHAVQVRSLWLNDYFKSWNTIDTKDKVLLESDKFQSFYEQMPSWTMFQSVGDSITKARGDTVRQINLGKPGTNHKLFIQTIARSMKQQSSRTNYVTNDEVGQYKDEPLVTIIENARGQLLGGGGQYVGFQIIGGTSNTNSVDCGGDNLLKWQEIHEKAEMYEGFSFFIGRQHVLYADPITGWPKEKEVEEQLRLKHEGMKNAGTFDLLTESRMNHPITRDDCFLTPVTDDLNFAKVITQIGRCKDLEMDSKIIRGKFEEDLSFLPHSYYRPTFVPNNNPMEAGWLINRDELEAMRKMPFMWDTKPSIFYVSGSDNADKRISRLEQQGLLAGKRSVKLSMQAMVVLRVLTGSMVAMYEYRHENPEDDWKQMLLGCLFFRCALNPEINKPGNLNYFLFQSPNPFFAAGHFHEYLMNTPVAFARGASMLEYEINGIRFKREIGINTDAYSRPILVEEILKPYLTEPEGSFFGANYGGGIEPQGVSQCYIPYFLHKLMKTKVFPTNKRKELTIEAPDVVMAGLMAEAARISLVGLARQSLQQSSNTIDKYAALDKKIW